MEVFYPDFWKKKKEGKINREIDYKLFYSFGFVWIPIGIAFMTLGISYISIGLAYCDKWKKEDKRKFERIVLIVNKLLILESWGEIH